VKRQLQILREIIKKRGLYLNESAFNHSWRSMVKWGEASESLGVISRWKELDITLVLHYRCLLYNNTAA
jgi:hypothetical protein